MALGCSGRSWEIPGAGGRLCPSVHALLYRLPCPMFARGILGTQASSLWSCYITASLPSVGSALQQAGAEAGTRKKACSLDRRLPKSTVSARPLPPCRGRGLNKHSASSTFSQQGPLVLPLFHVSTAPVSGHMLAMASPSQQTEGAVLTLSLSAPQPFLLLGKGPRTDPCWGPSLAWRCLSCHSACGCPQPLGHLGSQPMQATSIPTCLLLWPRQRVLQQGFENLRHVHGRGHSDPVAA